MSDQWEWGAFNPHRPEDPYWEKPVHGRVIVNYDKYRIGVDWQPHDTIYDLQKTLFYMMNMGYNTELQRRRGEPWFNFYITRPEQDFPLHQGEQVKNLFRAPVDYADAHLYTYQEIHRIITESLART